jgi:hypothetical protein
VTGNFVGGAVGSAAGSIAWDAGGWTAVCAVGGAIGLIAVAVWLTEPGIAFWRSGRDHVSAERAKALP